MSELAKKEEALKKVEAPAVKKTPAQIRADEEAAERLAFHQEKRAERKAYLAKGLVDVTKRYKEVFNQELTAKDLEEYIGYCRVMEKNRFLEHRWVFLNTLDNELLREILKEQAGKGARKEE